MTAVWSELEAHGLVNKDRQGRLVRVAPRREDGRGEYTRPRPDQAEDPKEKYFILPDAFWLDGWHEALTFPGIAVLLMVLAETTGRDDVWLPYERVQEWYGISAKTLQNGLHDLRGHQLVAERREWVEEPLSAIGRTEHVHYSLLGPFSRAERQALQAAAIEETEARTKKAAPSKRRRKSKVG